MDYNKNNKEEMALEALLAAAFRLDFPEEISDQQAELFFRQPCQLSKEDRDAVCSWGTEFIDKIVNECKKTDMEKSQKEEVFDLELEQEFCGMNRDSSGNELDEEILRKIEKERKKAIEEENNKDENQANG